VVTIFHSCNFDLSLDKIKMSTTVNDKNNNACDVLLIVWCEREGDLQHLHMKIQSLYITGLRKVLLDRCCHVA
jgi:hypothetical protein